MSWVRLRILDRRSVAAAMAKMKNDARELSVYLENFERSNSLPPPANRQNFAASDTYLANVRGHRRLLILSRIGVFFFLLVLQVLNMNFLQ